MAVFRSTYKDPKTGERIQSKTWSYEFIFAGRRIRESAGTTRKTVALQAEKNRNRELEEGFNGIEDNRAARIRTIGELASEYLEAYKVRHRSVTFATYAVGHVSRLLGRVMVADVTDGTVKGYQTTRLKEGASPKTINEETGVLLRILGDAGEPIRAKLRRQKALKLRVQHETGKAYSPEEKARLLAAAKAAKSPAIYPALMLALNAGLRDAEIRGLQWGRLDLSAAILAVGAAKTEAGSGRTIPLNSALHEAMVDDAKWYTRKFGETRPEWYVFAFGKPSPCDPTRPIVTLRSSWSNVRTAAGVKGRWHDNRHTLITDLAESGAGDQTIMDTAGHVSRQMLKHYSHVRMEAKRKALQSIVAPAAKPAEAAPSPQTESGSPGIHPGMVN